MTFLGCSRQMVVKDGTIYTVGETTSEKRNFKITLKVYKDKEVDYSLFKKFRSEFKASDKFNPLLDKQLRGLIKESLLEKGFIEDNENPDFVVMGAHQNIFVPDRDPGIKSESGSFSGFAGGQYYSGTYHSGDGLVTAIVKAKMAQRYWVHEFGVVFFDPKTKQVIWIGNANAYVRVDDIRETAPDIIKALLASYPEPKLK
jgi:hypothetical protein